MATKVASLFAELGVDSSKLNQGLKSADGQLKQSAKGFGALKSSISDAAKSFGSIVVGAAVLGGATSIIKKSVAAASDLNETVTKTGVIFGDSANEIEKYADTAATAMGQSKQQAMDAASSFAVFGKAAGLSGQELVGFSTKLTTLTSDLASFYNTSPEEAIVAIGAALRGESEPIRRFGVLLDDATLRQKALEMGIISTTKNALTPQQRSLAAYQVILAQTGDAQGDFARTSGGLANQQRILEATTKDLEAELGKGLLPIWTKVVVKMNDAAKAALILIEWQEKTREAANKGSEAIAAETDNYEEYAIALLDARLAAGLIVEAQHKLWTEQIRNGKNKEKLIVTEKGWTRTQYEAAKGIQELNNISHATPPNIRAMSRAIDGAAKSEAELAAEAEAARQAQEKLQGVMGNLRDLIDGQLGPAMDDFRKTQSDLNGELADAQAEYNKLIQQGYSESGSKVTEVKDRIEELTGKIKENADEHDRATKRILFDLLAQQAAIDGLTGAEVTLLTEIANKFGLIDDATVTAVGAADKALQDLANGKGLTDVIRQFELANGLIKDINGNLMTINGKTFTAYFEVITKGQANAPVIQGGQYTGPGGQHGLNMIVPPGFPRDTFPLRASSGEQVIIIPKGMNINMNIPAGSNGVNMAKDFINVLNKTMRQATMSGRQFSGV